jgi:ribosomal peptide maturation radical SAM protein 1
LSKVALVCAPAHLLAPSLQIGGLKAYLAQNNIQADGIFWSLDVARYLGLDRFRKFFKTHHLPDLTYSHFLYGHPQAQRAQGDGIPILSELFPDSRALWKFYDFNLHYFQTIDWTKYDLIGISVVHQQLFAGLFLAKWLKEHFPHIPTVFGGIHVFGKMGLKLMRQYPFIDYVVSGEGEIALTQLCRSLFDRKLPLPDSANIISKDVRFESSLVQPQQIECLDELPYPDYDDYFRYLQKFSEPFRARVINEQFIPVESSRGCRWNRCVFCGLNLPWIGYREKSPKRVVREFDYLTSRHPSRRVIFIDSSFRKEGIRDIFSGIRALKKKIDIGLELRAELAEKDFVLLRNAGVTNVTVGLEALSTSLLRKMNKGTTFLDNLFTLKSLEEIGISSRSCIIMDYPFATERDLKESLANLDFAKSFQPPLNSPFYVDIGSPICRNPAKFSVKLRGNKKVYSPAIPSDVLNELILIDRDYECRAKQDVKMRRLWNKLKKGVELWWQDYAAGKKLLCLAREDYTLILDNRTEKTRFFFFHGLEHEIYRLCHRPIRLSQISVLLDSYPKNRIKIFLKRMAALKLVYEEDGQYLSLACRILINPNARQEAR